MDKNRFDGFTRQLAKRENRRQAIKTLFAGGIGTAAVVVAGGETSAASRDCCPADHPTLCGLTCTDTIYSVENCGDCGVICAAGEQCYQGVCESDTIVHCARASDCPGSDTDCTKRTCKKGVCGVDYTASGKKVAAQTDGDCQKDVCDGAGNVITVIDNTDKPDAQGECWTGICVDGVAQQAPRPAGRNCSNGKCDGLGHCTGGGCSTASDCAGTDTECATRTCTGGVCGMSFQPDGTSTSNQTAGDCQKNVCDGAGNIVSVADDTDFTPPYYGDPCHDSICTAGVPSHPPLVAGTPCIGGGGVCDGNGACVECVAAADCQGTVANATTTCVSNLCSYTCNEGYGDCSSGGDGCETNLMTDLDNCGACNAVCSQNNGTATCNNGACQITCNTGFANCDNDPSTGCEIYTERDPANCGTCGHVCFIPNGTAICANGACALGGCNVGFGDCDGDPRNGCEADLLSDPDNCSNCGIACADGQTCQGGFCV